LKRLNELYSCLHSNRSGSVCYVFCIEMKLPFTDHEGSQPILMVENNHKGIDDRCERTRWTGVSRRRTSASMGSKIEQCSIYSAQTYVSAWSESFRLKANQSFLIGCVDVCARAPTHVDACSVKAPSLICRIDSCSVPCDSMLHSVQMDFVAWILDIT
jgi:hypothetical protein